jgi:hypothetical protein
MDTGPWMLSCCCDINGSPYVVSELCERKYTWIETSFRFQVEHLSIIKKWHSHLASLLVIFIFPRPTQFWKNAAHRDAIELSSGDGALSLDQVSPRGRHGAIVTAHFFMQTYGAAMTMLSCDLAIGRFVTGILQFTLTRWQLTGPLRINKALLKHWPFDLDLLLQKQDKFLTRQH